VSLAPGPPPDKSGPGADPGVQAVSPQVTLSHLPGGRLHAITFRQACGYLPSRSALPLIGWYQIILLKLDVKYVALSAGMPSRLNNKTA